jgi:hypothetical protein
VFSQNVNLSSWGILYAAGTAGRRQFAHKVMIFCLSFLKYTKEGNMHVDKEGTILQ